jgi:CMD domain protein
MKEAIMSQSADVIDRLVGIKRGSALDEIRGARRETRDNAQKSYQALFSPDSSGTVSLEERYAIAVFVAGLHRDAGVLAFYRDGFAAHKGEKKIAEAVEAEAERGAAKGPYGRYPKGPLSAEDKTGSPYQIDNENRRSLGPRLSAALEHTHLLIFRPREASPEALQSLLDAGWSTTDIVTLSQLVSFLSFQIRVIAGLRALAANPPKGA